MAMLAERKSKTKYILNPRNSNAFNDVHFGRKMLEKMGWQSGEGLGANKQGVKEPLRPHYKNDVKGIGYKNNVDNEWLKVEDQFSSILQNLSSTHLTNDNDETNNLESIEEKSETSKARLHYRKFTRNKDVSRYSEKDLSCILGSKEKNNPVESIDEMDTKFKEVGTLNSYFEELTQKKSKKRQVRIPDPSDSLNVGPTDQKIKSKKQIFTIENEKESENGSYDEVSNFSEKEENVDRLRKGSKSKDKKEKTIKEELDEASEEKTKLDFSYPDQNSRKTKTRSKNQKSQINGALEAIPSSHTVENSYFLNESLKPESSSRKLKSKKKKSPQVTEGEGAESALISINATSSELSPNDESVIYLNSNSKSSDGIVKNKKQKSNKIIGESEKESYITRSKKRKQEQESDFCGLSTSDCLNSPNSILISRKEKSSKNKLKDSWEEPSTQEECKEIKSNLDLDPPNEEQGDNREKFVKKTSRRNKFQNVTEPTEKISNVFNGKLLETNLENSENVMLCPEEEDSSVLHSKRKNKKSRKKECVSAVEEEIKFENQSVDATQKIEKSNGSSRTKSIRCKKVTFIEEPAFSNSNFDEKKKPKYSDEEGSLLCSEENYSSITKSNGGKKKSKKKTSYISIVDGTMEETCTPYSESNEFQKSNFENCYSDSNNFSGEKKCKKRKSQHSVLDETEEATDEALEKCKKIKLEEEEDPDVKSWNSLHENYSRQHGRSSDSDISSNFSYNNCFDSISEEVSSKQAKLMEVLKKVSTFDFEYSDSDSNDDGGTGVKSSSCFKGSNFEKIPGYNCY